MGGECSASIGALRNVHKIYFKSLKERDHSEDVGVDGRIILKRIEGKEGLDVDWIHLAQNGDRYRAFVNTVMNLRFS
jgi:hypothetical protein